MPTVTDDPILSAIQAGGTGVGDADPILSAIRGLSSSANSGKSRAVSSKVSAVPTNQNDPILNAITGQDSLRTPTLDELSTGQSPETQTAPLTVRAAKLGRTGIPFRPPNPTPFDATQVPRNVFTGGAIEPGMATEEEKQRAGTVGPQPDVTLPGPHGFPITVRPSSAQGAVLPGLNPDATLQGNAPIINPERGLIAPQNLMTETEQKRHPILTGLGQLGEGLTTPQNLAILAGTAGFSELPVAMRTGLSTYFAAQMAMGANDYSTQGFAAYMRGDTAEAKRLWTLAAGSAAMGGVVGAHGIREAGLGPEARPEPLVPKGTISEPLARDEVATPKMQTVGAGEKLAPETAATLKAQTDALSKGTNPIVYFPKGQGNLPEPPENATVTVVPGEKQGAGTYYHDDSVTPEQIKTAVDDGSYHKLLGYTQAKEEAIKGKPAGVVARDANGTELNAGLVDSSNPQAVAEQAATFARQFPESKIGVESPESVITNRQAPTPKPETLATETPLSGQTQAPERRIAANPNYTGPERRTQAQKDYQAAIESTPQGQPTPGEKLSQDIRTARAGAPSGVTEGEALQRIMRDPAQYEKYQAADQKARDRMLVNAKNEMVSEKGPHDAILAAMNQHELGQRVASIKERVASGEQIPVVELAEGHALMDKMEVANAEPVREPATSESVSRPGEKAPAEESRQPEQPIKSEATVLRSAEGAKREVAAPAKRAVSPESLKFRGETKALDELIAPHEEEFAGTRYSGLSPAALKRLLPEGVREKLDAEVEANQRARGLQGKLYDLESQNAADLIRARNVLKEAPGTPADQEALYHHLENPEEALTAGQQRILDGYLRPMLDKSERINEKLEGGQVENYVYRIPVGKGNMLDRIMGGEGKLGAGGRLSKSSASLKGRTMMALEDETGNRRVVSIKDGKVTAFDQGQAENLGRIRGLETQGIKSKGEVLDRQLEPMQRELDRLEVERRTLTATKSREAAASRRIENIDNRAAELRDGLQDAYRTDEGRLLSESDLRDRVFVDKSGKQWKIGQATTKEIEANTGVRYYKNALASTVLNYLNLRRAERSFDFLESYKRSPDWRIPK